MKSLVFISFFYLLISNVESDNVRYCGLFAQSCGPDECLFLKFIFPSLTGPIKEGGQCGLLTCPCEDGLICKDGTCTVDGTSSETPAVNSATVLV